MVNFNWCILKMAQNVQRRNKKNGEKMAKGPDSHSEDFEKTYISNRSNPCGYSVEVFHFIWRKNHHLYRSLFFIHHFFLVPMYVWWSWQSFRSFCKRFCRHFSIWYDNKLFPLTILWRNSKARENLHVNHIRFALKQHYYSLKLYVWYRTICFQIKLCLY